MKSLMLLWQVLADELASWCHTSAARDFETVAGRSKHEGLSFLTITLPAFGKDFEKALDQKQVSNDLFCGFNRGGGLPRFLGGFLSNVFDRASGSLLDDPCVDSIFAVRQLTLMFSKVSVPCSDARVRKAMQGYIDCEKDVRRYDNQRSQGDLSDFLRISDLLFAGVLSRVDNKIHNLELTPRHGPGATADKLLGNKKFTLRTWTRRLERILPAGEFLLPSWRFYDQLGAVDILEPGDEIPDKVISVPKPLKTPRIIGVEPSWHQYAQQSLLPAILDGISSYYHLDTMLGFTDQTPNQEMARLGSHTGELATLDLSEASDRVPNSLVRAMMRNHPHVDEAVQASRSQRAWVRELDTTVSLAKFASMGSALTFPLEAMVFLTLIFLGIERELNEPFTSSKDFYPWMKRVRVYGDDIVIPVDYVSSVIETLESFGFVVNSSKSFWSGSFRESCGKDYYDGHDVTTVKVRQLFPTSRRSATEVVSLVSLRNQLYFRGLWKTCAWLDDRIRVMLKHYPVVLPTSSVLGRHSYLGYETEKLGSHLHNPLVRGWTVKARPPLDPLEGVGALHKVLTSKDFSDRWSPRRKDDIFTFYDSFDPEPLFEGHLERAGRPKAVTIHLRYASPF